MRISKTFKVLIAIFIVIYLLFLFEIVFLNKDEKVYEYQKIEDKVVTEKDIPVETTITFFGDMMFDRGVWHSFKKTGIENIFSQLDKSKFEGSDVLFANLEGPISVESIVDVWIDDSLNFNMPPETINALKYLGIDGVSLANNHTLNAGSNGFATTQNILQQNNIKYAGYQNNFDSGSVVRFETEIPISVICVSLLGINPNQEIIDAIKAEGDRFVIIYPHWGVEYATVHNQTQENLAHGWIDAGADLVVGSHPHVVQDVEIYQDVPIFYSLGNFVFDQTFSEETQEGLAIKATIEHDNVEIELMPFASSKMKPKFLEEYDLDYYVGEEYVENKKIVVER